MEDFTQIIKTFPSVIIPNKEGKLPVEVSLIAQLGHGAGNQLFADVALRQSGHKNFIDELDEPSAKLADINLSLNDPTSLYSFVVGPKGHPFHRHAGHRIFTAISGSGGAQLRFSTATMEEIEQDPENFIKQLHFVNIPADCLFTVRFGDEVWHQFWPLSKNSMHPVFFALSCHTNELGGNLSKELQEQVKNNEATIPSLTKVLPKTVSSILTSKDFQNRVVTTTTLALDAPAGTIHRAVCDTVRSSMGIIRQFAAAWSPASAYISEKNPERELKELGIVPDHLLLHDHFSDIPLHHEDTFSLSVPGTYKQAKASEILESVLEGFLINAPKSVSRLMLLRNILVKPLGLRTSPLGCPVSSLLSNDNENLFAEKYPVIDQRTDKKDQKAEVILGADDKHLKFRSCVSVEILSDTKIMVSLGNRVHCKNNFGKFYMSTIDYIHRKYISPTILRRAVDYAIK